MIKRFFNSTDVRILKEQSNLILEELSDGIYLVVKDRFEKYDTEFASSADVLKSLRFTQKTVVVERGGSTGYANYLFDTRY
jgi:hypothetical protein